MNISGESIMRDAIATGFRPEMTEKVIYLMNLLNAFQTHPFLKDRLVLKGGTALNLFLFDLPRLSIDIDLNYIAAQDRQAMLDDRPKIEKALGDVCAREGIIVSRIPASHAGGKWSLRYESALTGNGNLEVDLNYMFRTSLWPIYKSDSVQIGSHQAKQFPVLDLHELAAGKLAALFARHASRDLFDAHRLLTQINLDPIKLRLGFVVYGAMNRKDWRTIQISDIAYDTKELENQLLPVIRHPNDNPNQWAQQLIQECQKALNLVLPLLGNELQFLDALLDRGEVHPQLLTDNLVMQSLIKEHPLIQWKAINVRKYSIK